MPGANDGGMLRSTFLAAAAATVVLPQIALAQAAPLVPLRVAILGGDATSEPIYGVRSGIFAKHGLAVTVSEVSGGAAVIAAVAGGSFEAGFSNIVTLASAAQRGLPIVMLAPAAIFNNAVPDVLLVKARAAAYKSGADLSGKTVAVTSLSGLLSVGASAWIDKTGGDAKNVHFVELPLSEMSAALKQGRIDAAMISEPYITQNRADVAPLGDAFAAIAPRFIVGAFVASKPWAQANADVARRFSAAMIETAHWSNANHAATGKMLADDAKLDAQTVATMARSTYGDSIDPGLITPAFTAALKYGALKTPGDAAAIVADARPYWAGR
jgi:NitT/TauT family transport system substrate-binding protein